MRIHLAGEHAHEFEARDPLIQRRHVAFQFGEGGAIILGLDQLQQVRRVGPFLAERIEFADRGLQPRTLAAEFLRAFRLVPDLRIL